MMQREAPFLMAFVSARCPSNRPMAPRMMDLPAPVSPVITEKPEWKRILLVAEMAAPELKPGPEAWNNARISVTFLDATGKTIGYGSALELKAPEPEFREIRVENAIPTGSAVILLQAGLFKAQGIVLLKSLQVVRLGGE